MKKLAFLIAICFSALSFAQTTLNGKVVASDQTPIPGANIIVLGTNDGAVSDFDGNFTLKTDSETPFRIKVTSIGFSENTMSISNGDQFITVVLDEVDTQLDEIIISASRTPERLFESPVSVERFGLKEIKNTSSVDFYDGLQNLKGIDLNVNSLTFKSINTRGFATFANTRFMQLVDGMDNSSPALNFVLGNLVGMNDLDVLSVEVLPGASSALYGANAFNGILFMRSKSPFDFEGVSSYVKTGVTSQKAAGTNQFYDVGVRAAKKFSDKFAAKINVSYMEGEDWHANRVDDLSNPGATRSNPGYDGLNVYGDEVATTLNFDQLAGLPSGTVGGNTLISRTGYREDELTTHDAKSVKYDMAMHWRPTGGALEVILNSRMGKGATIYQGANRYYINDFTMAQNKIEIKDDNFFVRAYRTTEDAGKSYDTRFAAINVNRAWKSDTQWFTDYATAFIGARLGIGTGTPLPADISHAAARAYADNGRLIPGTSAFQSTFNEIIADGDLTTGARFIDQTSLTHIDANYNLSYLTGDVMDVQIGGSYRKYNLNSQGTIFTDTDGAIPYKEYGLYTQIQKKMADERLKLTASMRYDKNELFDGFVSPRGSFTYTLGEDRNHNLRASFQTGFRNPTTQDLYIGLNAGLAHLVGSSPDNLDRYSFSTTVSTAGQAYTGGSSVVLTGRDAYENAYSAASVMMGAPKVANTALVKPEQVTAVELGYRGQFDSFSLDISGYYNQYSDFIANSTVLVPKYGKAGDGALSLLALVNGDYQPFQAYTNSSADVSSFGLNIGMDTTLEDFDFGFNYTFSGFEFDKSSDPDFEAGFNTPRHKFKAYLGAENLTDNIGFNINYRWSDSYLWQASFADGMVPSYSVIDMQVNYRVPDSKAVLKMGAANLFNEEYFSAIGTGSVGAQYYLSLTFNN